METVMQRGPMWYTHETVVHDTKQMFVNKFAVDTITAEAWVTYL